MLEWNLNIPAKAKNSLCRKFYHKETTAGYHICIGKPRQEMSYERISENGKHDKKVR